VRARLLERFGFHARALAQPVLLCEVIAAIQSVRGIDWVDVNSFGAIPETELQYDADGHKTRELITQEGITDTVRRIVEGDEKGFTSGSSQQGAGEPLQPPSRIDAQAARVEDGRILPAQLAFFTPAVPDTLILNPVQ